MSTALFESDSESGDEDGPSNALRINEDYASKYKDFKAKEIKTKLEAKYGKDAALGGSGSDSDSSSSSEDEDAEEDTEEKEVQFFAAMSALRKKDPKIYDKQTNFFEKDDEPKSKGKGTGKKSSSKPMFLGDMERIVMTEKGGKYEDVEDASLAEAAQAKGKSYHEEMEEVKENLKMAMSSDDSDDDDDDDGLLKEKVKSSEEIKKEEAGYREWLAGQQKELEDKETEEKLRGLKESWSKKDLDEDEAFLKDYILNKRYLGDNDLDAGAGRLHDSDDGLSEDEKTVEEMEEFEHKYNFRFEEPDQEFIKKYPRTIKDSMRAQDSSRKKKREEKKERKAREKEKRDQELKQLKSLKRKEIEDKLSKLKKICGNDELAFEGIDLDGDFDPAEYDRQMAGVFDNYESADVENEGERPEFSSDNDSDIDEDNWDDWSGLTKESGAAADYKEEAADAEDPNFVMDCDYEENLKERTHREILESTRRGKRWRKSKFAAALERKKPLFDPAKDNKSFEQYVNEYYELDCEDVIGKMKCRFRYRPVASNDFGLSTQEVLSAPDRELNSWCSLKKTCQYYRDDEEEEKDVRAYVRKGKNEALKRKILPSLFEEDPEKALEEELEKKSAKRKKRKAAGETDEVDGAGEGNKEDASEEDKESTDKKKKKKKKKKKAGSSGVSSNSNADAAGSPPAKKTARQSTSKSDKKKNEVNAQVKMQDSALEAYQINANQFKRKARKLKYKEAGKA